MRQTFRQNKAVALITAAILGTLILPTAPAQAEMDAERGKTLFAERGCVICHSVNNVGSNTATSLDASNMNIAREPFEFFARMWRGAPQMLALQQADLGYQIDFSGRPEIQIATPGVYLDDVTSTKQNVTEKTGVLVMCWGQNRRLGGPRRAYFQFLRPVEE